MKEEEQQQVSATYDKVARKYADAFFDELDDKPLDRLLLDRFAKEVKGSICDIGCGPGEVAAYLAEQGAEVFGIDHSERMVEEARRLSPKIPFLRGDMYQLPLEEGTLAGITAFYAIVHSTSEEVRFAFAELFRVLEPGGLLFVSFHDGSETLHVEEFLEEPIDIDFCFHETDVVLKQLEETGFAIEEALVRYPYPEEYQSKRAYLWARRSKRLD